MQMITVCQYDARIFVAVGVESDGRSDASHHFRFCNQHSEPTQCVARHMMSTQRGFSHSATAIDAVVKSSIDIEQHLHR